MKQVIAEVISNEQILGELERVDAGTFKRPEARNVLGSWLMWLKCPEIAHEAQPGQFVMVRCDDYVLPRPISIHQSNNTGVALFYSVLSEGKGTKWLSERKKGEIIELFGPLGNGFEIESVFHRLLLVAGGMGIAPLCFLAQMATEKGLPVTLLYGTAGGERYPENLLPPKVELISATEDGSIGYRGFITDLIPKYAGKADQIFACGPMSMYQNMASRRKELKLERKPVQVSLEVRMGCGTGVCYGCTIKTKKGLKQVCADGPVFDLDEVLWDELNYL
ncbi:MAG: dihydroorotate dehydrogenase electron transfer subunit [Chloroflexota bacterium]